jgi:hypothetical protein
MKKVLLLVLLLCGTAWGVDAPLVNPKFFSIRVDSAGGGGVWFITSDWAKALRITTDTGGVVIKNGADSIKINGNLIVGSTAYPTVEADTLIFIGAANDTARVYYDHTKDSLFLATDNVGGARETRALDAVGAGGSVPAGTVLTDAGHAHTQFGIAVWRNTGTGADSLSDIHASSPTIDTSNGTFNFYNNVNMNGSGKVLDGNGSTAADFDNVFSDTLGGPVSLQGQVLVAGRYGIWLDTSSTADGVAKRWYSMFDTTTGVASGMPLTDYVWKFDNTGDPSTSKWVIGAQTGAGGSGDNVYLYDGTPLDVSSPVVLKNKGGLDIKRYGTGNDTAGFNIKVRTAGTSQGGLQLANDSLEMKIDGSTLARTTNGLAVGVINGTNNVTDNTISNAKLVNLTIDSTKIKATAISLPTNVQTFTRTELYNKLNANTQRTGTGRVVFDTSAQLRTPTIDTGTIRDPLISFTAGYASSYLRLKNATPSANAGELGFSNTTGRLLLYGNGGQQEFYPGNPTSTCLPLAGGTMAGTIQMGSNAITGTGSFTGSSATVTTLSLTGGTKNFTVLDGAGLKIASSTQLTVGAGAGITVMPDSICINPGAIADSLLASGISGTKLSAGTVEVTALKTQGAWTGRYLYTDGTNWSAATLPLATWVDSAKVLWDFNRRRMGLSFSATTDTLYASNTAGGKFWLVKGGTATYFNIKADSFYTQSGTALGSLYDNTTLAPSSGALAVKAGGIGATQLADLGVSSGKLAHDITVNADSLYGDTVAAGALLLMPSSAAPDNKLKEGSIAWDSGKDGLNVYSGTEERFIPTIRVMSVPLVDYGQIPADCDTIKLITFDASVFPQGAYLQKIVIEGWKGASITTASFQFEEWTARDRTGASAVSTFGLSSEVADSVGTGSGTAITDPNMAAGSRLVLILQETKTDVQNVTIQITYYAKAN